MEAFASVDDGALSLAIGGRTVSPRYSKRLRALAEADERTIFRDRHLDDSELTQHIQSAELIVLPYKNMHNSGAVLLALSLGRPVLVPKTSTTLELAGEVGDEWVITFEGELTGETLVNALVVARQEKVDPHFSGRDWDDVAAAHADLFHSLTRNRRENAQ